LPFNLKEELDIPFSVTQNIEKLNSPLHQLNSLKTKDLVNVLLTGSTGFLGAHLLHQLLSLNNPKLKVYCLVRAQDEINAKQRIEVAMKKHGIWKEL
jgi:hypothetical protein